MAAKNPLHTGNVLDTVGNTLFKVVIGGTFTTAGGDATETITDSIIAATDLVMEGLKRKVLLLLHVMLSLLMQGLSQ